MHDILEPDARRFFRDELREARLEAFRDAEGFQTLVFAIERLGSALSKRADSLGRYKKKFRELVECSALACDIPRALPEWHTPFDALYEFVRQGRNDALHQGAYARLVTEHTVLLSLIIEDALMKEQKTLVRDFMVRDAVRAVPWQPISSVRQVMLTNSFSFLPIWATWQTPACWLVLSDYDLAQFLRSDAKNTSRNERLAMTVQSAVQNYQLVAQNALTCSLLDPISTLFDAEERRIALVLERDNPEHLVGIITPFDIL